MSTPRAQGHKGVLADGVGGRGRKLRLNYRTTEEIRHFACVVLQGVAVDDLDEGDR
jgi:hypothetical protein